MSNILNYTPFLVSTRETVQFNTDGDYWCDVNVFEEVTKADQASHANRHHWEEAITLYRGSFLESLSIADNIPLKRWALLKREQLQRQALTAIEQLAIYYERQGEYERACEYARRQTELEPLQEQAHQTLMRLLALSGQRNAMPP